MQGSTLHLNPERTIPNPNPNPTPQIVLNIAVSHWEWFPRLFPVGEND